MEPTNHDIPKEKLLDNSDLYEIPEHRVEDIKTNPVNDRKEVSDEELDRAYHRALSIFQKWQGSITEELPQGNKGFLADIQTIIEEVDRALAFKYKDERGIDRQMIFKPERLKNLDNTTLKNRLELQ